MDVVGAVMRELHLSAAGYRRLELGAPWAVSFSQAGLRGIHIVLKGRCEVAFDHGPAQQLEQGDLIIAPRADAHVLRSRGATRTPVVSLPRSPTRLSAAASAPAAMVRGPSSCAAPSPSKKPTIRRSRACRASGACPAPEAVCRGGFAAMSMR